MEVQQTPSESLWAEQLTALQREVAVLTKENDELKAQLREAQSPGSGGEELGPEELANREAYERELKAFKASLPALLREYDQKYVAIRQGHVVDTDADEVTLAVRVCRAYPDDYVLVRRVDSSGESESWMGGPVWGD